MLVVAMTAPLCGLLQSGASRDIVRCPDRVDEVAGLDQWPPFSDEGVYCSRVVCVEGEKLPQEEFIRQSHMARCLSVEEQYSGLENDRGPRQEIEGPLSIVPPWLRARSGDGIWLEANVRR
jgi:hypothetical protein